MQCLVFFIIALLIIGSLTPLGESVRTGHPRVGGSLRKLAAKYNGTFRSGGVFMAPNVRLRHGSTWLTITSQRRRGAGMTTRAEIGWPDDRLYLMIRTRDSRFDESDAPRDMLRYETGAATFDPLFGVWTNDLQAAKTWLSDAVRWQLTRLATAFGRQPRLLVVLRQHTLLVEKNTAIHRFDDMEQFYLLAAQLYDQAMLTRATGIQFVAEDEAQPLEAPVCKVCGEPIDQDMVVCRRCRTPHHLECWQYAGKCSIFGCPETRYDVPRVARTPEPPEETP